MSGWKSWFSWMTSGFTWNSDSILDVVSAYGGDPSLLHIGFCDRGLYEEHEEKGDILENVTQSGHRSVRFQFEGETPRASPSEDSSRTRLASKEMRTRVIWTEKSSKRTKYVSSENDKCHLTSVEITRSTLSVSEIQHSTLLPSQIMPLNDMCRHKNLKERYPESSAIPTHVPKPQGGAIVPDKMSPKITMLDLKTEDSQKNSPQTKNEAFTKVFCPTCGVSFKSKSKLEQHGKTCEVPGNKETKKHVGIENSGLKIIPIQGEPLHDGTVPADSMSTRSPSETPSKEPLLGVSESEPNAWRCHTCDLSFATYRSLGEHLLNAHSVAHDRKPSKTSKCPLCRAAMTGDAKTLGRHVVRKHLTQGNQTFVFKRTGQAKVEKCAIQKISNPSETLNIQAYQNNLRTDKDFKFYAVDNNVKSSSEMKNLKNEQHKSYIHQQSDWQILSRDQKNDFNTDINRTADINCGKCKETFGCASNTADYREEDPVSSLLKEVLENPGSSPKERDPRKPEVASNHSPEGDANTADHQLQRSPDANAGSQSAGVKSTKKKKVPTATLR